MTQTTNIYTAPTNTAAAWLDAFCFEAVVAAIATGSASVSVTFVMAYYRQAKTPDAVYIPRAKVGSRIRASLNRLTRGDLVTRTTGPDAAGRTVQVFAPGPSADVACLYIDTAADVACQATAEAIGQGNAAEAMDQVGEYESQADAVASYEQNVTDTAYEMGIGDRGADLAFRAFVAALAAHGFTYDA